MSMLDSFFKQRFNAAKCKTLLKLTIPRIKLLRNRREIQIKQMRKDIAKLLETGQEATARIRVEHIIREEKMMAAQEIVELFCELIAVRLPIIEAQRECPLDLKEAISSVCFAAPRCADLQELIQVQILFACKYGKEFVLGATELMPDCGVNRQLIELLSIRAPAPDVKLNLLKEIAEEYELDWDPSATESELLKPHEDLLNGPTQFATGSKLPLPEEKPQETTYTAHENTDSDAAVDSDILSDFPEVPKQLLQPNNRGTHVSTPEMLHFPASSLSESDDPEDPHPSGSIGEVGPEKIAQDKQFLPFIIPPPQSREHTSPQSPIMSETKDEDVTYNKLDLQDVLAAAQAAADSAERAAAAARSAASLAQLRISELLLNKKDGNTFEPSIENQYPLQKPMLVEEKAELEKQESNVSSEGGMVDHHQPQRLPSMDDETYFSYPNLFTHQGSNLGAHDEQAFVNPK